MKLTSLVILFFALTASLTVSAQSFNKDKVSFSFPSDWSITEEDDLYGEGYYVSCEKNGKNSSGLATFSWVHIENDLDTTLNTYVKALEAQKLTGFKTGKTGECVFGRYKGICISYEMTVAGLLHKGKISAFHVAGKTITVICQEAVEDTEANKAGFEKIISSFAAK